MDLPYRGWEYVIYNSVQLGWIDKMFDGFSLFFELTEIYELNLTTFDLNPINGYHSLYIYI